MGLLGGWQAGQAGLPIGLLGYAHAYEAYSRLACQEPYGHIRLAC